MSKKLDIYLIYLCILNNSVSNFIKLFNFPKLPLALFLFTNLFWNNFYESVAWNWCMWIVFSQFFAFSFPSLNFRNDSGLYSILFLFSFCIIFQLLCLIKVLVKCDWFGSLGVIGWAIMIFHSVLEIFNLFWNGLHTNS